MLPRLRIWSISRLGTVASLQRLDISTSRFRQPVLLLREVPFWSSIKIAISNELKCDIP